MLLSKILRPCLAGLAISTQIFAASFEDGLAAMQKSLPTTVKAGVSLKQFMKPLENYSDREGNQYLSYQKEINGIKVFGEKKLIVYPAGNKNLAHTKALTDLNSEDLNLLQVDASAEAKLSLEQASNVALSDLRSSGSATASPLPKHLKREPELVWFRSAEGDYKLVYHITLPGQVTMLKTSFDYFIDAQTGNILNKISNLHDLDGKGIDLTENKEHSFIVEKDDKNGFRMNDKARNLEVYNGSSSVWSSDADANWESTGTSRKTNQRAEVELYLNMAKVIDYYRQSHGFIWENGKNPVVAVAHVNENFNNAYFSPWEGGFFFGDGSGDAKGFDYLTKGLDVAGHEYTHGVINMYCPLTYSNESGALNEHIADFFGACVDADEWQMGDNIAIGDNKALRNMEDPTNGRADLLKEGIKYAEWAKLSTANGLKFRVYPDRIKFRIICSGWGEDNGGVHLNSSIFNKWCYLAATGNQINGKGLGRKLLADIYFRLLKNRMVASNCSFKDFKAKMLASAELELAQNKDKDAYIDTMKKAFDWIGL